MASKPAAPTKAVRSRIEANPKAMRFLIVQFFTKRRGKEREPPDAAGCIADSTFVRVSPLIIGQKQAGL
jgi:hypothetical protein